MILFVFIKSGLSLLKALITIQNLTNVILKNGKLWGSLLLFYIFMASLLVISYYCEATVVVTTQAYNLIFQLAWGRFVAISPSFNSSFSVPFSQPGDGDLDWDEEFALQDFLKNELAERNCRVQDGRTDSMPEDTVDKLTNRGDEENGEERWMVVDTVAEGEARDTSTPLSALPGEAQPGQGAEEESQGECGHQNGRNNHQATAV